MVAPAAPDPESGGLHASAAPLEGERLFFDASSTPEIEVLFLPGPYHLVSREVARSAIAVARSAAELSRLEVTTAAPVDFKRWLLVVPLEQGLAPAGARRSVVAMESVAAELRIHRRAAGALELLYTRPCELCGGASSVEAQRQTCEARLMPRAVLVERPRDRLTVGIVDTRCNPASP